MAGRTPMLRDEEYITSPAGIILYPHVFEIDQVAEKYNALLVLDTADKNFDEFRAKVVTFYKKAVGAGMPKDASVCLRSAEDYINSRTGESGVSDQVRELIEGKYLLAANSKNFKPTVYRRANNGDFVTVADTESGLIYSGIRGAITGKMEAWKGQYSSLVFRLSDLAKLADGDRIGGRDPNTAFKGLADEVDESVSGGAPDVGGTVDDDEIPF